MASRMDKYKTLDEGLTRSNKNKELYKQVYNAYDEYDNLIVPSNAKEITLSDLKKEIAEEEYKDREDKIKEEKPVKYDDIDNIDIYDINKMINKAVTDKGNSGEEKETTLSNGSYLKKLKIDSRKTNIEQVKEMYDDIREEAMEEDESLLKTANLSLEILSDLKSDNDITKVSAPIKNEELPEGEDTFYSSKYKFSDKDFEKEEAEEEKNEEEDEEDDDEEIIDVSGGKFFFKILLLIIGLMLIVGLIIYLILYFGKA